MSVHDAMAGIESRLSELERSNSVKPDAAQIAELRASVAALGEKLALSERFATIEREHESWKTLAKVVAVVISLVGGVLGYVGYSSVREFRNDLQSRVTKQIEASDQLSYGMALVDKNPEFAIAYLLPAFNEKPFNEPLVIGLLNAVDDADDRETARSVLKTLSEHPKKVDLFTQAATFTSLGNVELTEALENASELPKAKRYLETGLKKAAASDTDNLWRLHYNLWRYYLLAGDPQLAQRVADAAAGIEPPGDLNEWDQVSKEVWWREMFAKSPDLARKTAQLGKVYGKMSRKE